MTRWLLLIFALSSTAWASTECLVRGFEGQFKNDRCAILVDKISVTLKARMNCPLEKACHPALFGQGVCLSDHQDNLKSNLTCLEKSQSIKDISELNKQTPEFLEHFDSIYQELQIFCNKDFGDPRNQIYCKQMSDHIDTITQTIQNQTVVNSELNPASVDEHGEINIAGNFSNNFSDILDALNGKPSSPILGEIQRPDTLGLNDERILHVEDKVKKLMEDSLCKYQNGIEIENLDDIMKIAHKLFFSNEYMHDKEVMQSTFCLLEKYYLTDFERFSEQFDELLLRSVKIQPLGMDTCP